MRRRTTRPRLGGREAPSTPAARAGRPSKETGGMGSRGGGAAAGSLKEGQRGGDRSMAASSAMILEREEGGGKARKGEKLEEELASALLHSLSKSKADDLELEFLAEPSLTVTSSSRAAMPTTSPTSRATPRFKPSTPLQRKNWLPEEDAILRAKVKRFGEHRWSEVASYLPLRTGKQCYQRWNYALKPDRATREWSAQEDLMVLEYHQIYGNKWTQIASHLEDRSGYAVKNRYRRLSQNPPPTNIRFHAVIAKLSKDIDLAPSSRATTNFPPPPPAPCPPPPPSSSSFSSFPTSSSFSHSYTPLPPPMVKIEEEEGKEEEGEKREMEEEEEWEEERQKKESTGMEHDKEEEEEENDEEDEEDEEEESEKDKLTAEGEELDYSRKISFPTHVLASAALVMEDGWWGQPKGPSASCSSSSFSSPDRAAASTFSSPDRAADSGLELTFHMAHRRRYRRQQQQQQKEQNPLQQLQQVITFQQAPSSGPHPHQLPLEPISPEGLPSSYYPGGLRI